MKTLLFAALMLFIAAPFPVSAQSAPAPQWTASPKAIDPHEYNDPAMHFVAPKDWAMVGFRVLALTDLSDDAQIVAGWASLTRPQSITITQQLFDGNVSGFSTRFQNDLRGKLEGVLIKSATPMSLKNGMPAYFIDATYGSGFTTRKQFSVIWADGSRGVAMTVTGRVGEIDASTAKRLLSDVSAVAYPAGRE